MLASSASNKFHAGGYSWQSEQMSLPGHFSCLSFCRKSCSYYYLTSRPNFNSSEELLVEVLQERSEWTKTAITWSLAKQSGLSLLPQPAATLLTAAWFLLI